MRLSLGRTISGALAIACVLVAALTAASPAHAYTVKRVTVAKQLVGKVEAGPLRTTLTLAPGQRQTIPITVVNALTSSVTMHLDLQDIAPSQTPDTLAEFVDRFTYGASSWMHLETGTVSMAQNTVLTENITVTVPKNATAGSHYAGIQVHASGLDKPHAKTDANIGLVESVGLEIFVNVPGDTVASGALDNVRESTRFTTRGNKGIGFTGVYTNTGNLTSILKPTVTATGIFGNQAIKLRGNEQIVLRGGTRDLLVAWNDLPWIGRFTPTFSVDIGNGRVLTKQLPPIVILPPWYFWVALAVLLAIPVALWIRRRRAWRRYLEDQPDFGDPGYDE